MKICSKCRIEKPLDQFYKRSVNKDGYCGACKICDKMYIKSWKEQSEEYRIRETFRKKARIASIRSIYFEYMKDKKCIDCGITDFRVLVHDHVRGTKVGGIGEMINGGRKWENVLIEIDKCEIRCVNCHTIVTGDRGNWWWNMAV